MLLPFQALAIVGSAAFAGVMLAIGIILGGFWISLPAADFLLWFQNHNHLVVRTIPLVVVPTLVGLAGSLWLSWADRAARLWWLAALGCIIAVLALTAAYFLPMNATFVAGTVPLADVPARLGSWLAMHWLRIVLAFVAAVLGIVAVARQRQVIAHSVYEA